MEPPRAPSEPPPTTHHFVAVNLIRLRPKSPQPFFTPLYLTHFLALQTLQTGPALRLGISLSSS
jgi:hypothetical protein